MSKRAGQPVMHGPMQSPAWSDRSNSSAILRDARTSSESVWTTMPADTGTAHDGVGRMHEYPYFARGERQQLDGLADDGDDLTGIELQFAARQMSPDTERELRQFRSGVIVDRWLSGDLDSLVNCVRAQEFCANLVVVGRVDREDPDAGIGKQNSCR